MASEIVDVSGKNAMETTAEPGCGKWVRIKSQKEILSTLDASGTLNGLPFMPEMALFCGHAFRVRSHPGKTCVDARPMEMRTFPARNVFLLEGTRCPGTAHGGCERECALFWDRRWLEPISASDAADSRQPVSPISLPTLPVMRSDGTYFCQSTQLRSATTLLSPKQRLAVAWWDWQRHNLPAARIAAKFIGPAWRKLRRRLRGNWPRGSLHKTPTASIGLQPGDLVRVKPMTEILKTLDGEGRNRGLVFEPDMAGYCERPFRVRRRVQRMIAESTGKMLTLMNTVTLEEIVCTCPFTFGGCPRTELQLWREIWLEKV